MKQFTGFMRGVNLGGWFSQCDYSENRYDTFIQEKDIRKIASWGLDHVRVPVDYNLLLLPDGALNEKGFARLQKCADWCRENGLNMLLDLHKTMGYSFDKGEGENGFFDSSALQDAFIALWQEIARRFGGQKHVAFELLNEVTKKEYGPVWNAIIRRAVAAIRPIAPDTKIVVGGYYNNAAVAVRDLEAPADENIVYTFHCYEPLIFTHQGAGWIDTMDTTFRMAFDSSAGEYRENTRRYLGSSTPEQYPDELFPLSARYFIHLIEEAARYAEKNGVPLYCGEYGVIDRARPEDALKWYACLHEAFEHFGIGRAAWSYKQMDFGLTDDRYDGLRDKLISLL